MFLDLADSTSIAKRIGDTQYIRFLDDFLTDVGRAIQRRKGEVYKYVGDEVIVSWRPKLAEKEANCLRCYFDARLAIDRREQHYLNAYGVVPQFRAGIHVGPVVTGSVGHTRLEIAFAGDVVNTTARILETCKMFSREVVVSSALASRIKNHEGLVLTPLGETSLRGKEEALELIAVDRAEAD